MKITQAQERTRFAHECVAGWGRSAADAATRLKGLPVEVRTGGLGTAVAVLLREGGRDSGLLAGMLAEWLLRRSPRRLPGFDDARGHADGRRLLELLARADALDYRAAQREALALLEQAKLLADALHGSSGGGP
jgi:hypothetical protein